MPPTTRQTLSYLRTLFRERGIVPKNKLGQNFLIDLNLVDLVVATAEIGADDLILEVGSGTGGLTLRLLDNSAPWSASKSTRISGPWSRKPSSAFPTFAADPKTVKRENVGLVRGDALANKNAPLPALLQAVADLMAQAGTKQVKLIANLPYAVAVPVISNLLLTDLPVERMVVMVQWEIAERLTASLGVKDYAALAVLAQSLADVSIVRRIGPTVFFPQPLVDSAIVMLKPNAAQRANVGNPQRFRNFLRDLYSHRRKNLRTPWTPCRAIRCPSRRLMRNSPRSAWT